MYNKLLNPLLLLVGVGDCRGQCPGIGPVSPCSNLGPSGGLGYQTKNKKGEMGHQGPFFCK